MNKDSRSDAIRRRAHIVLCLFLVISGASCKASATPGTVPSAKASEWTLANDLVSRKLIFDPAVGLKTVSWRDLTTNTEFIDSRNKAENLCYGFEVKVNGKTLDGSASNIRLDGDPAPHQGALGSSLDLSFTARNLPLRILVHYFEPFGFAGTRQWLTLESTDSKSIHLQNLTFDCEIMGPGPARDVIAFGNYGEQPRETFFTGRVNDVAVLLECSLRSYLA